MPRLVKFLARFGLFVHVKLPGQNKSKSVLLYHAAPKASYTNFAAFDDDDFDDVPMGGGASIHVESRQPSTSAAG